jgi:hypothetical protein
VRIGEIDRLGALFGIPVRGNRKIETVLLERCNLRVEGNHAPFELQAELLGDGFGEFHFETGQLGAVIIVEGLKAPLGRRNDGAGLLIASHSRAWDGPPIISDSGMTTLNNLARNA